MAKKIVIKVAVNCGKDKKDIMKSVAKLEVVLDQFDNLIIEEDDIGIDEMKLDTNKGTLTIIGDVDPVCVIKALRKKCGRCAEIESIGPPKPPDPPKEPNPPKCPPPCLPQCPPPPCRPSCPPPPCPPPCPPQPCYPPRCSRDCDYDRNPCPIL